MLRRLAATALVALFALATLWLVDGRPAEAQVPPTPTRTPTASATATVTPTATVTATATPTPGPWPMFQHDPRRTGRSQFPGPARAGQRWAYDTGTGALTGSPIVGSDGTIYIGGGGYLHAIAADGASLWRLPVGTSFGTVLQAVDGTLYATGATG